MSGVARDLRYALRALSRSPGFAVTAIVILGLGIGATTAIFTVVNGVLLRPLPYPESGRIVSLREVSAKGHPMAVAGPNFRDIREQSRSYRALAEVSAAAPVTVLGASEPERSTQAVVSKDFFRVMGVQPARGRPFLPEEEVQGAAPAVVVSHAFWQRAFGGASIAGKSLTFGGRVHSVVGVMPDGFDYPRGTELWTPAELDAQGSSRTAHNWSVVGRLADGVPLERARADASSIAHRVKTQYGSDVDMVDVSLQLLRDAMVGNVRTALLVFLGATAVLLLIAVANVSNLLLARLAARRQETAVRVALGAGFRLLVQQLMAESLVLSLVSGAVGVALAYIGTELLLAFHPTYLPRMGDVSVNGTVLLFALAVSLVVAVALSVIAALSGVPRDIRGALAGGQRTLAGSGSGRIARDVLLVIQTGLTLVLLAGAALMARSILHLLAVDTGFRTQGVLEMNVAASSPDDMARVRSFDDRLLAQLRASPGVRAVGGISNFPLQDACCNGTYLVLDQPDEVKTMDQFSALAKVPSRSGNADWRVASAGYFEAMHIPLVRGRIFGEGDAPDAPVTVAVVSESFARRRWPGRDPIGRLIQFGNMDGDLRALRVVGVVSDVRAISMTQEPEPTLYAYYRQRPGWMAESHIAIWTRGDPQSLIPTARKALHEVDPTVPPTFSTVDEVIGTSTADRRFSFLLLGVFGATALILAVAGMYAVVSYLVTQRTREIGVRIAFGAHSADVLRLVMGRGAVLALIGIGLGVVAALALTRVSASMLYGVTATDPLAYLAGALLLATVAIVASYVPARRAAMLDPVVALRSD
ncbi:MAG: ABC transporter permease [Gemmatimonadota bacterium]|nr:ABC transporter permease [Gemmatimonadota bacterium]